MSPHLDPDSWENVDTWEADRQARMNGAIGATPTVPAATLLQRLADARVDLLAHLDANVPERAWLPCSDRMLACGGRHHIAAPLKSGKSLGFLVHAVNMAVAGAHVVILDRENGADEYARRLRDILTDRPASAHDAISERLAYYAWPALKLTDGHELAAAIGTPDVVILDSTRTFLSGFDLDEDSSDDFATFAAAIIDPLFRAGIATIQLDNTGHGDTGRARGSSSKGDLADVLYSLKTTSAFDERRRGALRLVRSHSRYGDVAPAFTMELGGGHFGTFTPDATAGDVPDTFRPTTLMGRISRALQEEPGLSKREIRQAVTGKKNDAKDRALKLLEREGYVRIERDGRADRHYLERPFDDNVPDRAPSVPGTPGADRAPVPPPLRGHEARAPHRHTPKTASGPGTLNDAETELARLAEKFPDDTKEQR